MTVMILRPHFLPVLLMSIITVGCAETSLIKFPGKFLADTREKHQQHQVARILCLWEPAEGQGLDGRPSRGFAGQILFFGFGDAAPVPVHGTVRIYEYENFNPDEIDPTPAHVFVFDDSGWNAHRAESTVGQGYNVFLPRVKNHQGPAHCALKIEFTAENGRTISSPVTEITLDSRQRHGTAQSAVARNVIRKTAGPAPTETHTSTPAVSIPRVQREQLESLTIRLPRAVK